ncbi:MAG TPA: family 16 glycoside hydrolase [Streptosporangiaceae bacterium]
MRFAVGTVLAVLSLAGCGGMPAASHPAVQSWRIAYNGYGHVGISGARGDYRITLEPARPDSATTTHSALVLSATNWSDLIVEARIRTNIQLRKPDPNSWEVGWLLWHYVDDDHFYYFILKPNGYELGKEDRGYPGHQRFLATANRPAFPVGRWYVVRVQQRGAAISVSVDGRRLVSYVDIQSPYRSGRVGLYAEDASVTYKDVTLKSAP